MIGLTSQYCNTQKSTQYQLNYSNHEENMPPVKIEEEKNNSAQHDLGPIQRGLVGALPFDQMKEDPQWKRSICSKGRFMGSKQVSTPIHHRYSILAKNNPKISNCIRAITQQIKHQLLIAVQASKIQQKVEDQTIQKQTSQEKMSSIADEQIVPDKVIVKESCFRGLLKPTQIDNDVPSDEQDLNNGIRYMYGQLLYSVGSEIVNQRQHQKHQKTKPIAKPIRKQEHDKENINTNLPQQTKPKAKVIKTKPRFDKAKGEMSCPNVMVRH